MCTVVFMPAGEGAVFASLRDENPQRVRALAPVVHAGTAAAYLAPTDPQGGGTWVGVNEWGHTLVLLNGGFTAHPPGGPYRMSRGLIVKELLQSSLPVIDWSLMRLQGVEPFTLVVGAEGHLFELVWDGQRQHRRLIDATRPQLWSSATLYHAAAKALRQEAFDNWAAMNPPLTPLRLLDFFKSLHDPQHGFLINRNGLMQTLSYTFVELQPQQATMSYYDLQQFAHSVAALPIIRRPNEPELSELAAITPRQLPGLHRPRNLHL